MQIIKASRNTESGYEIFQNISKEDMKPHSTHTAWTDCQ